MRRLSCMARFYYYSPASKPVANTHDSPSPPPRSPPTITKPPDYHPSNPEPHTQSCDTPAVRELVGSDPEVTDANLLCNLGIVEQRANELMLAYALSKGPEHAAALQEVLRAQPAQPPATRIVVDPPSTLAPPGGGSGMGGGAGSSSGAGAGAAGGSSSGDDGSGGEGEPLPDDVPLSREVLQARVLRSLGNLLERSLKVKPVNAHVGGGRGSARRQQ